MKNVHKIGTSRAGPNTRIWLEGNRLLEAGFKQGLYFERTVSDKPPFMTKTMTLRIVPKSEWDELKRADKGTVAGKPDRPIIDITGAIVAEIFDGYKFVSVNYLKNKIVIDGTAEND